MKNIRQTHFTNGFWPFSQLDLNCRKMVIKGLWLYNTPLNEQSLALSLSHLLNFYPHLAGRICENAGIEMNNAGVLFDVVEKKHLTLDKVRSMKSPLDKLNMPFNLSAVLKGESAPLKIQLTKLADGTALCVHCSHLCLDGNGFYTLVNNWSKLHRNAPIETPILEKPDSLMKKLPTKEQTLEDVKNKGWYQVGFRQLFQLLWQTISGIQKKTAEPIYFSPKEIENLKRQITEKTSLFCGTHVALATLLTHTYLQQGHFKKAVQCQQITVADIRERMKDIKQTYVGNAVINIRTVSFPSTASLEQIAANIQNMIQLNLKNEEFLTEYVQLNMAASTYMLPYVPFDLQGMGNSCPSVIYINNQLRFPIYEVDFGTGKPIYAFPNDLPDSIKFWPTPEKGGVEVLLSGYLAQKRKFF